MKKLNAVLEPFISRWLIAGQVIIRYFMISLNVLFRRARYLGFRVVRNSCSARKFPTLFFFFNKLRCVPFRLVPAKECSTVLFVSVRKLSVPFKTKAPVFQISSLQQKRSSKIIKKCAFHQLNQQVTINPRVRFTGDNSNFRIDC